MKQSIQKDEKTLATEKSFSKKSTSGLSINPRRSINERISSVRDSSKQGTACDAGFGN